MEQIGQWIGIDVYERWLDVHIRHQSIRFRVANAALGIEKLKKHLKKPSCVRGIILESTGGMSDRSLCTCGHRTIQWL